MSVSDPLIKDVKGFMLKLFIESQSGETIVDSNENFLQFCHSIETAFHKGIIKYKASFHSKKKVDVYSWMVLIAKELDSCFPYNECIKQVLENSKSVVSPIGKFRLLIRCCIMRKCLHMPLELLIKSQKNAIFYDTASIMGNEILSAILLSALLQCSKINFQLQLENVYFLDYSWRLPTMIKLELVPSVTLGMGISFSDNKAVIVHLSPNSVASESEQISIGDVLVNLNGSVITSSCKGRLNTILRSTKNQPVTLIIIKAFEKQSNEIFSPLKNILKNLQIDINNIQSEESKLVNCTSEIRIANKTFSGYKARYLGTVPVGNKGNVKQIEQVLKSFAATPNSRIEKLVIFEIKEMCVKILDIESNEIFLKHSFMQISSCGSLSGLPHYIAYIAGDESSNPSSKFTCYVFYVDSNDDASTILQRQGFYRTHFVV